jgi:N-acetyl-gamma-glutamylphosphate reductase
MFFFRRYFGLAPLLQRGLGPEHLVVDGLRNCGLCRSVARDSSSEIGNNVVLYNVVGHRHTHEMEQELGALAGQAVRVHFTPCYIPIVRGIVDICRCFPLKPLSRKQAIELFQRFYEGQPFVKIYDQPRGELGAWDYKPYPWVSAVAGTNYCHIGLDVDEARSSIVVMSVLDSVGKGGAQVAIENLNIMAGFTDRWIAR